MRHTSIAHRAALRLALVYAAAASLWILFSDRILGGLGLSLALEREISSVKGLLFVVFTAAILYAVARRYLTELHASRERYQRLFEHATEGLMVFRVLRAADGRMEDLVVVAMNPTQSERWSTAGGRALGRRLSERQDGDQRLRSSFELVADAVTAETPMRDELHVEDEDVYEALITYPIDHDLWALAVTDMTEMRRAEEVLRRQEADIRQAYVDVLDAVTGGKLVLLTEDALAAQLGRPLGAVQPVTALEQLAGARRDVAGMVMERFPQADRQLLTPVCEALNNVLKHAGGGEYQVFETAGRAQVMVADDGPGIDFRRLPKATLVPGYSTVASLGMGFTIMLQLCERVLLSTRPGRTVVVLEFGPDLVGLPAVPGSRASRASG